MNCLIVYSSVTGNTRLVAEAVHAVFPQGALIAPVHRAPEPDGFDLLVMGFWTHRAGPDPRAARYMQRIRGKAVAYFGTLAAWPDSPHAMKVRERAEELLAGNRILGGFLCQGKLEERRFAACMAPDYANQKHPMTEERRARLLEARRHPDERDLAQAQAAMRTFIKNYGGDAPGV